MELTQILQKALEIGGSDIFLIPGSAATAKVKGHLVQLTEEKLLPADTADMIREAYGMAGDHSDELLHRDGDDDFSFSFNRQARFRCNAYKQHAGGDLPRRDLRPARSGRAAYPADGD